MPTPPKHPLEALDLTTLATQEALGGGTIRAWLVLEGPLDLGRLERALENLGRQHPLLGFRPDLEGEFPAWVKGPAPARLRVRQPLPDPLQHLARVGPEALDPPAPGLRATVWAGGPDTHLMLSLEHAWGDGAAFKGLLADLAAAYTRDQPAPPLPDFWSRRSLDPVLQALDLEVPGTPPAAPGKAAGWGFDPCRHPAAPGGFHLCSLEAPLRDRLREGARRRGATFNDVLVAANHRALCRLLDPPPSSPCQLLVTVDLRRHLPAGSAPTLANLSGWEALFPGPTAGAAPLETLDAIRAQMGRIKAARPGVAIAQGAAWLARQGYPAVRGAMQAIRARALDTGEAPPMVSNIGWMAPPDLAFGAARVTRALLVPPTLDPPNLLVGASSFGGETTLAITGPAPAGWAGKVLEECRRLARAMEAMAPPASIPEAPEGQEAPEGKACRLSLPATSR